MKRLRKIATILYYMPVLSMWLCGLTENIS